MSNAKLEALTQEFLAAYAAKDIDTIRSMFAETVILRDWNLEVTGKDAAIREFESNFQKSEHIEIKVNKLYSSGSGVSAEIKILVDKTEKLNVVDVLEFDENQKILSIVSYKGL